MKFQKQNGRLFRFNGIDGVAYTSSADCPSGDVAMAQVEGRHGKTKNILCDRFYFIAEGTGKFIVDGKDVTVTKDDVIMIPKNTPYDFEGSMKVIIFCSPAFDPSAEIDLEQ